MIFLLFLFLQHFICIIVFFRHINNKSKCLNTEQHIKMPVQSKAEIGGNFFSFTVFPQTSNCYMIMEINWGQKITKVLLPALLKILLIILSAQWPLLCLHGSWQKNWGMETDCNPPSLSCGYLVVLGQLNWFLLTDPVTFPDQLRCGIPAESSGALLIGQ